MLIKNSYQRSLVRLISLTFIVTMCTTLLYGLGSNTGQSGTAHLFNFVVPLFFLLVFGLFGTSVIRREPLLLWTPAAMFLAYTALFKGLGPLVHVLGNDATLSALQNKAFGLDEYELLGTHLLNLVGTMAVLIGILFSTKKLSPGAVTQLARFKSPLKLNPTKVALVMIALGATIQYGFVYPYKFGLTGFTLPGTITKMGQLLTLGIALLAYVNTVKKNRKLTLLFWVLLIANVLVSFLEFFKSIVVLSVILPAFGAYAGHRNLKKLSIWLLAAMILYLVASPIVNYGRASIFSQTNTINRATFSERFDIVTDFFSAETNTDVGDNRQNGWSRLSYAGQQAYAMREHGLGNTFNSLNELWIVFIPRAIWPNKPVGIGPGKQFFYYVSGRDTNRSSVTVYADAYWNFGWIGLMLTGLLVGVTFGKFSEIGYYWLSTNQVIYYPVMFSFIDMNMRGLNSWIVNGLAGRFVLILGYIGLIYLLSKFLRGNANRR